MKDNDKYEYFQYIELDKRKEKSKQEVDKINDLIREKEMNIIDNDAILKLKNHKRDVQEELRIVNIKLKELKVSEEKLNELRSQ